MFVDGTKIRANASIKNSWTKECCGRHLKKIDKRIEEILSECEIVDEKEKDQPSLVKMKEELKAQEALKFRVREILGELQTEERKSTNTTGTDCTKTHGRQGSQAGYNMQSVADEKHGLIVSSDVINTVVVKN